MTYIAKPKKHHPALTKNELGLTRRDYEGSLSTLCAGCGHDSVTAAIIQACWSSSIEPHTVCKMSGIGCSSKTPAYFLGAAHGFNSVHGRMPSVTTGANAANRNLTYLAVSGDGDTASIGMGQFVHAIRRKLNMLYVVENNGVYGLTKGQFSATADTGSISKGGIANPETSIDLVSLAIQLGATYVARSFSGDKEQLVPLIEAGLKHKGFALIDVISPCVTFNNHEGSTKSYDYMRKHDEEINEIDWIPSQPEITLSMQAGEEKVIPFHDGSLVKFKKMEKDYDPTDAGKALDYIRRHQQQGSIVTGLLYVNTKGLELHENLNTSTRALRDIPVAELCPGQKALDGLMAGWR